MYTIADEIEVCAEATVFSLILQQVKMYGSSKLKICEDFAAGLRQIQSKLRRTF